MDKGQHLFQPRNNGKILQNPLFFLHIQGQMRSQDIDKLCRVFNAGQGFDNLGRHLLVVFDILLETCLDLPHIGGCFKGAPILRLAACKLHDKVVGIGQMPYDSAPSLAFNQGLDRAVR